MRILYRYSSAPVVPCYGYLYNFYTIEDNRELTSTGWRVTTKTDYDNLIIEIDDAGEEGLYLKEQGTTRWDSPNTGATNSTGFTLIGSGTRLGSVGTFRDINTSALMWTSTAISESVVYRRVSTSGINYFAEATNNGKSYGMAVRLIMVDPSGWMIGDTYTGNDGKVYQTVKIGTQVFITENLEETQYRNGSVIEYVEEDATWAALTTGALCLYDNDLSYACKLPLPVIPDICFGYLYNWYTVGDSRELTSSADWTVPTKTNFTDLETYCGGTGIAGGRLKEVGTTRWDSPNTGATNQYSFSMIGSGSRYATGEFNDLLENGQIWGTTSRNVGLHDTAAFYYDDGDFLATGQGADENGRSIRLISDATGLSDGITTTYTGNDGKTYNAIVINELYWTTENLEETEYRDASTIPNVTDDTTWAGLTTGALCLYDNDAANACKLPLPFIQCLNISNMVDDGITFSVASEATGPSGFRFKPNGTSFYVLNYATRIVYQYNCSTPFDLTTASYSGKSSGSLFQFGLEFSSDGTEVYGINDNVDSIYQYNLSTAWDISTMNSASSISIALQDTQATGVSIKPDGLKIYIIGRVTDTIYEYDMSTPFDITTATYNGSFLNASASNGTFDFVISSDGKRMILMGNNREYFQYSLAIAWDISSATYDVIVQGNIPTDLTNLYGIDTNIDGNKLYVLGFNTQLVYQLSICY